MVRCDPAELRASFWAGSPGPWDEVMRASEHMLDETLVCGLGPPENLCSERFSTRRALVAHQMKSKRAGHGITHPIMSLVQSNMCPICGSVLRDARTAKQHIVRAYISGYCTVGLSGQDWAIEKKGILEVPGVCVLHLGPLHL